ncbi:hypothetical protein [Methylocystis sp. S23]
MTIYVTDHALLRYIERIHGVDVETLRKDLQQRALRCATAAQILGASEYRINCGDMQMRVVGRNVVTIVPPREKA